MSFRILPQSPLWGHIKRVFKQVLVCCWFIWHLIEDFWIPLPHVTRIAYVVSVPCIYAYTVWVAWSTPVILAAGLLAWTSITGTLVFGFGWRAHWMMREWSQERDGGIVVMLSDGMVEDEDGKAMLEAMGPVKSESEVQG